jgi:hypothetical protein
MSGVARTDLRKDAGLLKPLLIWIVNERRRRLFSGTTDGLRDLIEPAVRVRRRQAAVKKRMLEIDESPGQRDRERTLESIFPELTELA